MLHERTRGRRHDVEAPKIKFLKKYIHHAKHRIQPDLTDELGSVAATRTCSNPNIEQLNNIVDRSKPFIGSHGSLATSYD
ncbi:hypothetical protein L1987_60440 [Smallanthus sonchifolius]|uniref:Uncharacterized protein n=1 Tax=Smallanthus sonchifolius TaxID=185202 RepID=A0ACB9D8F0_9ASTR|nr:hypothetical protein L1987_60440 [Smallanthus sonchifolius]